jgi:hypothetical protein
MEFSFWEELIFGIGFTLGSIRDAVVSERRVMPFCAPAIFSWSQRGTHSTAETNEFDQNPPSSHYAVRDLSPTTFPTNRSLFGTELSEAFRFKTRATTT